LFEAVTSGQEDLSDVKKGKYHREVWGDKQTLITKVELKEAVRYFVDERSTWKKPHG
jgi:hypothetical protein